MRCTFSIANEISSESLTELKIPVTRHDSVDIHEYLIFIVQAPSLLERRSSSTSTMSSPSTSSSSTTPTPTPQSPISRTLHNRRSISPPLAPVISANNGRPVVHQLPPPPPPLATTSNSHRVFDERRYSPDALERQLNAEFHLLDGVEASMKQVDNMERLRSVALAQQEVVSLAQVLKNVTLIHLPIG